MHVVVKISLLTLGTVLVILSFTLLEPTIMQFVNLFKSLDYNGSEGIVFEFNHEIPLAYFLLLGFGIGFLANGYVGKLKNKFTSEIRTLIKRSGDKIDTLDRPMFKIKFFSFNFIRLGLALVIIIIGLGGIWLTDSGSLRFGFFTEDFQIISYGLEYTIVPLEVFYFAGLPFIIIGFLLLIHVIFTFQYYNIKIFKNRYEIVAQIFLVDKSTIQKSQITSIEMGITKARYKLVIASLVILLSLDVLIGWGISNIHVLPTLSNQLIVSGMIIIACMIIFVLSPKKHIKFNIVEPSGEKDVIEFKMNPIMLPKKWRSLGKKLGVIPDPSDRSEIREIARNKRIGNLTGLIVGILILVIGLVSFKNLLLVVGVGVPVVLIIYGLRLVTRWLLDMPKNELVWLDKKNDALHLYQKNLFGFKALKWTNVNDFGIAKNFKILNFFDLVVIMIIISNVTWYLTRTWFPVFSYMNSNIIFWITGLLIVIPIAWLHFHVKPTLVIGQEGFNEQIFYSEVFLEKGLGIKQKINKKWFISMPEKIKEYFANIEKNNLQWRFLFQVITFSWFFIAPLIILASGMPILPEGFPMYTLIGLAVSWAIVTRFYTFKTNTRHAFNRKLPNMINLN
ncbi:MAG: hypothetical protein ACTSXU_01075 [Promethearchaeota archaeon]